MLISWLSNVYALACGTYTTENFVQVISSTLCPSYVCKHGAMLVETSWSVRKQHWISNYVFVLLGIFHFEP